MVTIAEKKTNDEGGSSSSFNRSGSHRRRDATGRRRRIFYLLPLILVVSMFAANIWQLKEGSFQVEVSSSEEGNSFVWQAQQPQQQPQQQTNNSTITKQQQQEEEEAVVGATTLQNNSNNRKEWRQQRQRLHHRNFETHPVTSEESQILTNQDPYNFTAAICHPTIHGKITSMDRFFAFVSYYRLLGFDHIFMWYKKESLNNLWEDFVRLSNLSYVTMTEFVVDDDDGGGDKSGRRNKDELKYHGQSQVQKACIDQPEFGLLYDWVAILDADEFLWFDEDITIKEFLIKNNNYTYFSFGKWQYGRQSAISSLSQDSGFGLDRYPFTPGLYCYMGGKYGMNKEYCPYWYGRCKLLMKSSSIHKDYTVHGNKTILDLPHSIHYDHHKAHIKEWPGYISFIPNDEFGRLLSRPATLRKAESWLSRDNNKVGVHFLPQAFKKLPNGSITIHYDDQLSQWTKFVSSKLP